MHSLPCLTGDSSSSVLPVSAAVDCWMKGRGWLYGRRKAWRESLQKRETKREKEEIRVHASVGGGGLARAAQVGSAAPGAPAGRRARARAPRPRLRRPGDPHTQHWPRRRRRGGRRGDCAAERSAWGLGRRRRPPRARQLRARRRACSGARRRARRAWQGGAY
jgi:hypothetical protein